MVLRYSYLWDNDFKVGKEEGRKDRPCVVILALEKAENAMIVTVAPITHSTPSNSDAAVEIPAKVKQRLSLDKEKSWVIVGEVNHFEWPGPDIRPVPNTSPPRYDYGTLPPTLFKTITTRLMLEARLGGVRNIRRTH